ncbi:MAG: helix-turn-helix domain-containing protein [Candidatus Altiarchaeota archaeon]
MRQELIGEVNQLLIEAGFEVINSSGCRSSFDLLASKDDSLFVVKISSNVEGFTPKSSFDIRLVADLLGATPIVVSHSMKHSTLRDGVVYNRHGVKVVNVKTLKEAVDSSLSGVYSIRGNYCMGIDPSKLSFLRKRQRLSQQELAKKIGVSKQSIYRYESKGKVALDVALRLESFFNESLSEDIGLIEVFFGQQDHLKDAVVEGHVSSLKRRVLDIFDDLGFNASLTNAPFNLLAFDSERKVGKKKSDKARSEDEVFTIISNDPVKLERRVDVVREISDIVGGYTVTVSERTFDCGFPIIRPDELKELSDKKDFIRILKEY